MRTRTKWFLLGGLGVASLALVHCVGDDPSAPPGTGDDDAGDDGAAQGDTVTPPTDSGNPTDAGADAAACAAGVSPCILQIAGGGQNFCARDDQGKIYCWGPNGDGQLGTAPTATLFSATPLNVNLGAGVVASGVDVGGPRGTVLGQTVACARVSTGSGPATIRCWGSNFFGQLGVSPDASTTFDGDGGPYSATPTDVPSVTGVLSISVGGIHVCAISGANNAQCWGDNLSGELARDTTPSFDPTPSAVTFVSGAPPVDQVVVGFRHTCTLNKMSTPIDRVACAGQNSVGQLGRGDAAPFDTQTSSTLFEVDGPIYAPKIVANGNATCALFTNGSLECWGENGQGEMGIGSATPTAVDDPVVPTGLSGGIKVSGVAAGYDHFCALLDVTNPTDGSAPQNVYCWGRNDSGQSLPLAADAGAMVLTPTPVPGLPDRAIAITAGSQATCALIKGGTVYCWGENYLGELGNGDPGDGGISTPVKVTF